MRVIVQRTLRASVVADGVLTGSIDKGFMLLIGFTHDDTIDEIKLLAKKVIGLRIFEDECILIFCTDFPRNLMCFQFMKT